MNITLYEIKEVTIDPDDDFQIQIAAMDEMRDLQTRALEQANCGVDLSVPDDVKLADDKISPDRQSTIDRSAALKMSVDDQGSAHHFMDDFLPIKYGVGKGGKRYTTIDDSCFTYRFNGRIEFVITIDDTGKLATLIKLSSATGTPDIKLKATSGYYDSKTGAIRAHGSTLCEAIRTVEKSAESANYLKGSLEHMKLRRQSLHKQNGKFTGMASQSVTGWVVDKNGKAQLRIMPFTAVHIYGSNDSNMGVELHIGAAIYSEPLTRLKTDHGLKFTATVDGADYNPAKADTKSTIP